MGEGASGDDGSAESVAKRRRFGRTYDLAEGDNIEDYTLFYVGDESPTLSNIIMTHSKCEVYSYNPVTKEGRLESAQVNRALMRRYFLVQKAKDADIIGIAVGTLGVGNVLRWNASPRVRFTLEYHGINTFFPYILYSLVHDNDTASESIDRIQRKEGVHFCDGKAERSQDGQLYGD